MSISRNRSAVSTGAKQLKVRTKLRAKPRLKLKLHQLPWVGRDHEQRAGGEISFWDVPMTGGYGGGNVTGKAIALMYLAYLREQYRSPEQSRSIADNDLTRMLFDMFDKAPSTDEERDSIRGQVVGFACEINRFLMGSIAAGMGANYFDSFDWKESLDKSNKGLSPKNHVPVKPVTKPDRQTTSRSA